MAHTTKGRPNPTDSTLTSPDDSYRELIDSLGGIIWEVDARTLRYTFVSQAAERLLGYPLERWTAEPDFWRDHIHPDDRDLALQVRTEAARQGRPHDSEYRMIAADGQTIWFREVVTVITEDGAPVKLRGMQAEKSRRIRALETLKEKEAQYRAIFEATSEGLVINTQEGEVVEINPAFHKMHGYTHDEMIGMDPRHFVHPDYHEHLGQFFELGRAGQTFQTRAMDIRKDGSAFHIEVHGVPFTYNGKPHILGILRDITEQTETYEMLKLKEEQYRAVWDATSDGLAISDMNAQPVDVNPAWCNMHGYTREEMLALHPSAYVHPDSLALFAKYYEKVRAGERFQCEAVDVRKDGTPFNVEVHESPILYNGKPHTLTILRDITERVQAYELLEQRMAQRTQELSTLLEVATNVASTLELEPLLDRILKQLKNVVSYSRASITVGDKPEVAWDRERMSEARITTVSAWGDTDATGPVPEHRPAFMGEVSEIGSNLRVGKPSIIHDIHEADAAVQNMVKSTIEPNNSATREALWREERSIMFIPLAQKGTTIGGLTLRHEQPGHYTDRHARLAMGIAHQAALAIENGRLMLQAHEKAALEERQRLARELHNSVTQSLFSINLIARSVEVMLQREGTHSADTMEKMADLRQLTQGALAEMRALIFELRPGALEEEGLVQALRKHAAAVQGREQLQVEVRLDESRIPRLKPTAEEAVYRIVQESLHNVVKHARATKVEICMEVEQTSSGDRWLVALVADNGIGFDLGQVPPGHMGLGTMSQRAAALHAICNIESAPGKGTTVTARLPLAEWQLPGSGQ